LNISCTYYVSSIGPVFAVLFYFRKLIIDQLQNNTWILLYIL
jgi:hypothetical protein